MNDSAKELKKKDGKARDKGELDDVNLIAAELVIPDQLNQIL